MAEQTVFPGIAVLSVGVKAKSGSGLTSDFMEPIRSQDFDGSRIKSVIDRLNPVIEDELKITYKLGVKASSRPTAKMKARGFARVKNPFEVDVIDTKIVTDTSNKASLRDYYEIEVTVAK